MKKTFKKLAAAVALMGIVAAPSVMAKEDTVCFANGICKEGTWVRDDVFCFDGICTGPGPGGPKTWSDRSSYDKEEFWTPERIKNARAVEVITGDGVGRKALLAEETILDENIIPPYIPKESLSDWDFWTPERVREALPIGTSPLGAVIHDIRDVPDFSISIEEKKGCTMPDVRVLVYPFPPGGIRKNCSGQSGEGGLSLLEH